MSIFKQLFLDSFQIQGTSAHPGENQLFDTKFICKFMLQPHQNLNMKLTGVLRAPPCSARVSPFLCQEHHPVVSLATALSETLIKLKYLKGKEKSEA